MRIHFINRVRKLLARHRLALLCIYFIQGLANLIGSVSTIFQDPLLPSLMFLAVGLAGVLVGMRLFRLTTITWLLAISILAGGFLIKLGYSLFDTPVMMGLAGLLLIMFGLPVGRIIPEFKSRGPGGTPRVITGGFAMGLALQWIFTLSGPESAGDVFQISLGSILFVVILMEDWDRDRAGFLRAAIARLNSQIKPHNTLPFFLAGIHFGILQISIFFIVQCYVTATFLGYFAVVVAWLAGVVINLKTGYPDSYQKALRMSIIAYIGLLVLVIWIPPYHGILPIIGLLVLVIAFPAGAFFRRLMLEVKASSLFFHENNGFVIGFVVSLLGFVKWGVYFLFAGPLISFGIVFLSQTAGARPAYISLILLACLGFLTDYTPATAVMLIVLGIGAATLFVAPGLYHTTNPGNRETTSPVRFKDSGNTRRINMLILFIAGFNLILLQVFTTREFSLLLAATEITVLIVGTGFFTGFSVGYGLSRFISMRMLKFAAVTMFILHMGILAFIRFAAGYLVFLGFGIEVLLGLLFVVSFCTSSFYSILLPKLIEEQGAPSLASAYTWDLTGAGAGSLITILLTIYAPRYLWPLYFMLFLILLVIILRNTRWWKTVLIGGLGAIALFVHFQPGLQKVTTEDYYNTRGYDHPRLVFSQNSFYHNIDIIDTYSDQEQTHPLGRWSFINGILYFGYEYDDEGLLSAETGLSEFTYFLAELPAKYLYRQSGRKLRILIFGCGSMYSIGRVSPFAEKTTMVEIDRTVVQSAKACWSQLNRYDQWDNYELIIDDAKHFLATTGEKFDLIIMDISAPYTLGTMLLHNRDFYSMIRNHLKPGGIFSESTQGRPIPWETNSQALKILAGVRAVYPYYRIVDCSGYPRGQHGYVYATSDMEIESNRLLDIMETDEALENTAIYSESSPYFNLENTRPYSMTNMETLLSGNIWRLTDRIYLENRLEEGRNFLADQREQLRYLNLQLPDRIRNQLTDKTLLIIIAGIVLAGIGAALFPARKV